MAEEKKQFVLYEYLLFFWRKKWLFLIVPIITTLIVASAIHFLKSDLKFTGQAIVYTGSVNSPDLTNNNNIKARYQDLYTDFDVFVAEKGQVKFTVKGNSKQEVTQKLSTITERYNDDLLKNYNERYDVSINNLNTLKARKVDLDKVIEMYNKKIEEADQYDEISDVIIDDEVPVLITEAQEELSDAVYRISKMNSDLVFFEKPKVLFQNVYPSKTYLKESIAIGVILGILFTFALLIFIKYLGDARRYYKHD